MNKFKNSFSFVVFGVLFVTAISMTNRGILKKALSPEFFRLDKTVETIILGDSQTETALDPELIPNSVNISSSSEVYFFTYYKLKFVLDANPHIKNVILGYGYHAIAQNVEKYLYEDEETIFTYPKYFPLLTDSELKKFSALSEPFVFNYLKYRLGVPFDLEERITFIVKTLSSTLTPEDHPFWGGFAKREKNNLDPQLIQQKVQEHYYNDQMQYTGSSEIMKEYLTKISQLCSERGITLYLIKTPLHIDYRKNIPKNLIEKHRKLAQNLQENFDNIKLIDVADYRLKENLYGDGHHTNFYGAQVISKVVANIIK